ncbi:MAG: GNAT family N-acetyltransferase [Gemmatimonadetes bacterium]|nr:GNAT family N-acetyltransferase [Gemmatimonadota bacterium]
MDLVPATARLLRAEVEGPERLATALGVDVGHGWPPALYDSEALDWSLDQVVDDVRFTDWGMHYLVLRASHPASPVVVGIAGYKEPAVDDGSVEIGYSVLPAFQRRGLATEAVLGLVDHAFEDASVARVVAHTLPYLEPSIGVLCKAGFSCAGEVCDEGRSVVRYVRERGAA